MQQIYRRTPMPKCDFNKVAKHNQISRQVNCVKCISCYLFTREVYFLKESHFSIHSISFLLVNRTLQTSKQRSIWFQNVQFIRYYFRQFATLTLYVYTFIYIYKNHIHKIIYKNNIYIIYKNYSYSCSILFLLYILSPCKLGYLTLISVISTIQFL